MLGEIHCIDFIEMRTWTDDIREQWKWNAEIMSAYTKCDRTEYVRIISQTLFDLLPIHTKLTKNATIMQLSAHEKRNMHCLVHHANSNYSIYDINATKSFSTKWSKTYDVWQWRTSCCLWMSWGDRHALEVFVRHLKAPKAHVDDIFWLLHASKRVQVRIGRPRELWDML